MSNEPNSSNWKNVLCGSIAGISGVIVGHPFDTIKVRLQTQVTPLAGQLAKYGGVIDCITKTIRHERVRGLYKGLSPPLAFDGATNALIFGVYGVGEKYFQKQNHSKEKPLTISQVYLSGCLVGIFTSLLISPVELIKSRLQIQDKVIHYTGPIDCAIKIIKKDGPQGLYRGVSSTWIRDVSSFGVYFAAYELLKRAIQPNEKEKQSLLQQGLGQLFAGGMGGVFAWMSTYPADVIKSRLQTQQDGKYKGFIDCASKIFREEGYSAFFKGLSPTLIRAFPVNAAIFAVYEILMYILR